MNLPWVYTCSPSWSPLPPPSPYHPSGSSQCTSPKHPVLNLDWWFVSYTILYVSMPPPSLYHPAGSSQCTSPKHPVSCIEPGLAIHFLYDITRFNAILPNHPPLSLSHRLQKTVLYICVSFAVSHTGLLLPATAAKLLQSCPTLCNPIDGSPQGSSVPGFLQARTLEWVAISFSNGLLLPSF